MASHPKTLILVQGVRKKMTIIIHSCLSMYDGFVKTWTVDMNDSSSYKGSVENWDIIGLSRYEGFATLLWPCQFIKGLSVYYRFVKVWNVYQGMKWLSRYEGFINVSWVCQGMKGLLRLCRVCKVMKGIVMLFSGQILNVDQSLISFWEAPLRLLL